MRRIKVMADYGCDPLWVRDAEFMDNVSPNAPWLGLSDELIAALDRWAAEFDATLNRDDPRESGFRSPTEQTCFARRGRQLAERVAEEVGVSWSVRWFDHLEYQEHVLP